MTLMPRNTEFEPLSCHYCGRRTVHKVLFSLNSWSPPAAGREWLFQSQVTQCQGCQRPTFRTLTHFCDLPSASPQPNLVQQTLEHLYPPRIEGKLRLDQEDCIPESIWRVYDETYDALSAELDLLAGIGIRALVEAVCKDRRASGSNLKERIRSLAGAGVLSEGQANTLQSLRIMGNRSAHEVAPQTVEELMAAMDIAEHLIVSVYVIPHRASLLPNSSEGT